MRICLVYDCLYPYTVGGAERWYRQLADELAQQGHEVTYITRRQWAHDHTPTVPGVHVVAVSPASSLYDEDGRRRTLPPVAFALGVLRHLASRRGRYDVVHLCSFPYFPLLATRTALLGSRARVEIDWFELWTKAYWLGYAGPVVGRAGFAVQRLCVRLTPKAFVFSELTAARLRSQRYQGDLVRLSGLHSGGLAAAPSLTPPDPPIVLYAGRHTIEKQVDAVPPALARAREDLPDLRGLILGDGPRRPAVLAAIAELGLTDVVDAPGFAAQDVVEASMKTATCLVLPSMREGYGLVVVEAAAVGTPVVVVAGDDNAAVELVEPGVNGFIAPDRSPESLAAGIVAIHRGGTELRQRCAAWFERRAPELMAHSSAQQIAAGLTGTPRPTA